MIRRRSRKRNIRKKDLQIILILAGCMALVSLGHGQSMSYDFCTKLDNMDDNTGNYTELQQELHQMCGMNLDREKEELGTLSVEFMENLSVFSASWKENETTAREYAARLDRHYRKIIGMNMTSSKIPALVHSLYVSKGDELGRELDIQDKDRTNITDSISQLEETQSLLTTRWESLNIEAEYMRGIEQNVSHIYSQRINESNLLTSNLNVLTGEYERGRTRFKAGILPYLFLGVVLGGTIGFALGRKWKKEKRYWHVYSSSAKVASPLKRAALLTGALLAVLGLYLYLSGTWDAIATG
ncbi:MAG: hypothetical protein E4G94_06760 [ANME-2 cluster archaeon]|nr:MAG: hypothetical protein E4G94_06760 [ANME-2 cluster archaeon]